MNIIDARNIVKHAGDCSIWRINPETNEYCKICDCGSLRKAILNAGSKDKKLWEIWSEHLLGIDRSMENLNETT